MDKEKLCKPTINKKEIYHWYRGDVAAHELEDNSSQAVVLLRSTNIVKIYIM